MLNLLKIVRKVAYVLSVTIIGYILLSQLASFFSINMVNFDDNLGNTDYLKIMIAAGLLSAGAGIMIDNVLGKKIPDTFVNGILKDKIIILISASFLSYFFMGSGDFRSFTNIVLFALIFIFLIFLLPKLIYFFAENPFNTPTKPEIKSSTTNAKFNTPSAITSIVITVGVFLFVIGLIMNYVIRKASYDPTHRNQLYITALEPKTATLTQKVMLSGFNFGWKSNASYKLMSSEGEIPQTDWTNEKIEFTIPLSMKTGKNELWLIRPKAEPPHSIEESNHVTMRIVDRFTFYPAENEPKWKRAIKRIHRFIFFDIKIFNDYLY